MWKTLWRSLFNERGQEPSSLDTDSGEQTDSGGTTERAADDDSYGVRTPYDENTPDVADSSASPKSTQDQGTQQSSQQQADAQESFAADLNLDPSTFTPEMQEIFKRMQAGYTKKMQRFKGYEGNLQNMERFYNDRAFAEQTLRSWAQQNGLNIVPQQFNNQPAANQPQQGVNPMQARLVETLKAKLPPETQWMADGQAAAIFEVMKDVLGPVLTEFQGFKTDKEANEWKSLESQYDDSESKFAEKYPGWEAHEEDMSGLLSFLNDPKAYVHPVYGSKHEILYKAITGNATAIKEVTSRVQQANKNKTPTATQGKRSLGKGFANIQDEVAATPDRNDAFAVAANNALSQLKRRR